MQQKITDLLDQYIYIKAQDGSYYTPREAFEDDYRFIIECGLKDFADARFQDMEEEKAEFLERFNSDEPIEDIAYQVVEADIFLLTGGTVERKEEDE